MTINRKLLCKKCLKLFRAAEATERGTIVKSRKLKWFANPCGWESSMTHGHLAQRCSGNEKALPQRISESHQRSSNTKNKQMGEKTKLNGTKTCRMKKWLLEIMDFYSGIRALAPNIFFAKAK